MLGGRLLLAHTGIVAPAQERLQAQVPKMPVCVVPPQDAASAAEEVIVVM